MINEELRSPFEKINERCFPFIGFETIFLVDPNPRQFLPSSRQFITAPREFLLCPEQILPRDQPLGARDDFMLQKPTRFFRCQCLSVHSFAFHSSIVTSPRAITWRHPPSKSLDRREVAPHRVYRNPGLVRHARSTTRMAESGDSPSANLPISPGGRARWCRGSSRCSPSARRRDR